MNSDALAILGSIFGDIWLLFTSWTIPGTNVTPGAWLIFMAFVAVVIRFIKKFFVGDNGGT